MFVKWNPARLFLAGAIAVALNGVLTNLLMGNSALDIHMHDTYFILAHSHIAAASAIPFIIYSLLYFLFQKIAGIRMNQLMGKVHFWITLLGTLFIFWPRRYEEIAGTPHRYYDYSGWESFRNYSGLNFTLTIVILIVLVAQLLLPLNMLIAFFSRNTR